MLALLVGGLVSSSLGYIPLSLAESALGALIGYGILWIIKTVYRALRGYEGMGQGDLELLCAIGSFVGPLGIWWTLFAGSLAGTLCACLALIAQGTYTPTLKIPFGPFLALGACSYVLWGSSLLQIIF